MLFRRFFLVASLISLLGVGFANLVLHTRSDPAASMGSFRVIQLNRCSGGVRCDRAIQTAWRGA